MIRGKDSGTTEAINGKNGGKAKEQLLAVSFQRSAVIISLFRSLVGSLSRCLVGSFVNEFRFLLPYSPPSNRIGRAILQFESDVRTSM